MQRPDGIRLTARVLVAAVALTAIGGCMSVHPRVWQNGQAMSSSRAYQAMLLGDYSFKNQRALYSSATPLRAWHSDAPYTPFGHW